MMVIRWVAVLVGAVALAAEAGAEPGQGPGKHPVVHWRIDRRSPESYERSLARIMSMSEAEMLQLIPTRSCILFCGCPNCEGGQQENGQFDWSIERPYELRCRFCGHVYPSPKYPAQQTASGLNALGETVTYRYYLDPRSGRDFWFESHADRRRRDWFVEQCRLLARAYHGTQRPEYARRAALILDRFAAAYPHMAVLAQWPYRRRAVVSPQPPYPSAGGKWGRWIPEEVPSRLPEAYDLIHDSEELDRLSREQGIDVRRRIEDDFFRATVEYIFTFGKEPTGTHLNNMAPYYTENIVHIGRILGEPRYVHWGYRWVGEILRDGFFYDGMWHEAPSYHYQTIGGVQRVLAALRGYSDPPGYRSADGLRLENVDLGRETPFVEKALAAPSLVAYPNGRIAPIHDSWASERAVRPRRQTASALLPGFGHAALGRGRGSNQLQAHLHFSGAYGHAHADSLNLALFARGAELLSDIGYTHTKLRHWTISTISHNTVAIDRREQEGSSGDGDLLLFVPDLAGLSAVESRADQAYPKLAERYQRQLVLVPLSEADAYVVDVFRARGGSTHDWLLHGSADEEMSAECSLPLEGGRETMLEAGEQWREPLGESSRLLPYGLIRGVRHGEAGDGFAVTFRCQGRSGGRPQAGVRAHVWAGKSAEVFLGKSPRIREAEGDDRKVYDFWMPQLVVRRRGPAPLESAFAAVYEPFGQKPLLGRVRMLPVEPGGDAVAIEVVHGDLKDTILSTLDEPPYPRRQVAGGMVLQGRLGVLRQRGGKPVAGWLIDGQCLSCGDLAIEPTAGRHSGLLESATRKADGADEDAFVTPADLPEGTALAGRWLIATHGNGHTHGYEISHVARRGGRSVIVLKDDHGLRIRGQETEECYFPRRKIAGPNRFVIHASEARQLAP